MGSTRWGELPRKRVRGEPVATDRSDKKTFLKALFFTLKKYDIYNILFEEKPCKNLKNMI